MNKMNFSLFLGPVWRNPVNNCDGGTTFNNTCYKEVKQSNWFDAIDQCKSLGGSLVTLNSLEEAKFIIGNFTNMSLFWLHDLGQFSYGSVVWSGGSLGNSSRNRTFETKEYMFTNVSPNATYGNATLNSSMFSNVPGNGTSEIMIPVEGSFLCPVFSKEDLLEMNCSDRLFGVCEIPGEGRGERGGKEWVGRGGGRMEEGESLNSYFESLNSYFESLNSWGRGRFEGRKKGGGREEKK